MRTSTIVFDFIGLAQGTLKHRDYFFPARAGADFTVLDTSKPKQFLCGQKLTQTCRPKNGKALFRVTDEPTFYAWLEIGSVEMPDSNETKKPETNPDQSTFAF